MKRSGNTGKSTSRPSSRKPNRRVRSPAPKSGSTTGASTRKAASNVANHDAPHGGIPALLASHGEMARDSLLRLLVTPGASLMTILVIAMALLLAGMFSLASDNLRALSGDVRATAGLTLYLDDAVNESEGRALSEDLLSQVEVSAVTYVSREQALSDFSQNLGFADLLSNLGDNPLPASIHVTPLTRDSGEINRLAEQFGNLQGVEAVRVDLDWVDRLSTLESLLNRVSLVGSLILSLAVIAVVGNTIRLTIENRRREIRVVRLVGGTAAYIARPFLYTGLLLGLGGGLIACFLLLLVQMAMGEIFDNLLSAYGLASAGQGLDLRLSLQLVTGGGLLGWIGALVTTGIQLRSQPA